VKEGTKERRKKRKRSARYLRVKKEWKGERRAFLDGGGSRRVRREKSEVCGDTHTFRCSCGLKEVGDRVSRFNRA